MACQIRLAPDILPDKSGDVFVSVNFNKDDLVEEVKSVVVSDAIRLGLKNKNFDPSKFDIGLFSKGKLESLLPNNQKFSVKAASVTGNTELTLVYLPNLDKEKGKDKWNILKSTEEKKKEAEVKDTRLKLATEIVETERTYVQGLCIAIEVFLKPILANKLLSESEIDVLFGGLEPICSLNCKFLEDLESRVAQWKPSKQVIGDLFFAFAPHFKQYSSYVCAYDSSSALLVKLADNSKFQAFMVEAGSNPKLGGQTLQSLLITPIQRIPRYNLLLQELLKHTPTTHEDYSMLHKALQLVGTSAVFINEKVREQEQSFEIIKIESEFDQSQKRETLNVPGRSFVRRSKLKLLQATSPSKIAQDKFEVQKEYQLFLFSDCLLIAKNQMIGKLKEMFRLKVGAIQCTSAAAGGGLTVSWQEPEPIVLVFAVPEANASEWISDVELCLKKFKRLEEKETVSDSLPGLDAARAEATAGSKECRLCKKQFTLLSRRYTCKVCLLEACDDCSKGRQPLSLETFSKKERVCDKCKHVIGAEIILAERSRLKGDIKYTIRLNVLPFYVGNEAGVSPSRRSTMQLIPSPMSRSESALNTNNNSATTPTSSTLLPTATGSSTLICKKYSQFKEFVAMRKQAKDPIFFPTDMKDTAAVSLWFTQLLQLPADPQLAKQREELVGVEEKFWGAQGII